MPSVGKQIGLNICSYVHDVCVCLLKVFLQGQKNLNRAVNDDIVAVEILPREQWRCPSSLLVEEVEERPDDDSNDNETVGHKFPFASKLELFTVINPLTPELPQHGAWGLQTRSPQT